MKTVPDSTRLTSLKFWVIVGVLLAIHGSMAVDAAKRLSVTHDEYWHLPVGLLSWRSGQFDFDPLNPPLTRLWSALPLRMRDVDPGIAKEASPFGYGDAFRAAHPEDYDRQFFAGRVMSVMLSIVTGLCLAGWSRTLFGFGGGLLTAALWSFCPNIVANAGLVTPDIGLSCAFVLTLHAAWRFAMAPSWKSATWLGVCLGAAQAVKFTSLLLVPSVFVAWAATRWLRRDSSGESVPVRRALLLWGSVALMSWTVWNATYLFQGSGRRIQSYTFNSRSLAWFNTAPEWVRKLPAPLPKDYLDGLDAQRKIMEQQHPVYLDGEWRLEGFPRYYLYALAYKTPHGVQVICLLALIAWVVPSRFSRPVGVSLTALSGIVLLMLVASSSGMQLGLRYVLPVFPLLYLVAGAVPAAIVSWRSPFRQLGRGLLIVAVISLPLSLRFQPEHLAYFNELSGGPETGEQHLLDSNIDWGQDLSALRDYLKKSASPRIGLAYFGMVPPGSYGINYELPRPRSPAPGVYAISVNFVQGRPHTIRKPDGEIRPVDIDEFGYFRFFKPKTRIGASINVYELTGEDVRRFEGERERAR